MPPGIVTPSFGGISHVDEPSEFFSDARTSVIIFKKKNEKYELGTGHIREFKQIWTANISMKSHIMNIS